MILLKGDIYVLNRILDLNIDALELEDNALLKIKKVSKKDIAIIGLSSRMPMAEDAYHFWDNIRNGLDCVSEITEDRKKDINQYLEYTNADKNSFVFGEAAYIDNIDKFDYTFFGMSPGEAKLTDPNQRLFLETAWSAIEDAGYGGKKLVGSRTGVYLGSEGGSEYKKFISEIEPSSLSMAVPGNVASVIASRISYLLDLKGPSMIIDTACSSSLVAVHVACQAIRNGECDMAIAGGIRIYLLPFRETKIGVESSTGRTKTFDYDSDGLGAGEGVVAILLKPLHKAIEDNDNIYAVIKGSAVNQDGSSIGITAPNTAAQEEVIIRALGEAGLNPEDITYIEAHGSGTKLGDPIEIEGITRAFRRYTDKRQFCAIGSVKTNIGHLDTAAGIAGLLKAVLSIKYKEIAANIHFNRPNKDIMFETSPLYVIDELTPWECIGKPLTCGVSSFGMSGTNCHVILQEPPKSSKSNSMKEKLIHVLVLSAKSESALKNLIKQYYEVIQADREADLGDICYTASTGRGFYSHRIALIINNHQDMLHKLKKLCDSWDKGVIQEGVYYGICESPINKSGMEESNQYRFVDNFVNQYSRDAVKAKEMVSDININENLIQELCQSFIDGEFVNWELFYQEGLYNKVSLPTYPFEEKRCWIEIPKKNNCNIVNNNDYFFMTSWDKSNLGHEQKKMKNGCVLVLGAGTRTAEIIFQMRNKGYTVIEAILSSKYEKVRTDFYKITGSESDYNLLINDITRNNQRIAQIIHAFTLDIEIEKNDLDSLNEKLERGVVNLFRLTKVLLQKKIKEHIDLFLISEFVNDVSNNRDKIRPENATLFGLGKVIVWECPNIKVRCLDMDDKTDTQKLINELCSLETIYKVAYRNGQRYTEVLKKVVPTNFKQKEISIRENGIYIITGGTGRIGLNVAKNIAAKNKARLVLLNRSEMPDKEIWTEIIETSQNSELINKIKAIQEIEAMGSTVMCYSTDITDEEATYRTFNLIREQYGKINGVIHSAGVGVGMKGFAIEHEKEEIFKLVIAPKVEGTWILDKVTSEEQLDFFILFSSAVSLIGGIGGGDYTAANSYLDSFAWYRNNTKQDALTIGWPVWSQDDSWNYVKHIEEKQVFKIIDPEEAMRAFDCIYDKNAVNVIIGEFNYSSEIFELGEYLPFKLSEEIKQKIEHEANTHKTRKNNKSNNKVSLVGKDNQNYTDIEERIAQIWRDVLGYDEFNINDNFFEIGGDSIRIAKVHSMIEESFPGEVSITDLFAQTTIAKLSQFISNFKDEEEDTTVKDVESKNDIMELLNSIEEGNISIENALKAYNLIGEKDE